jgi:hypothetical protein
MDVHVCRRPEQAYRRRSRWYSLSAFVIFSHVVRGRKPSRSGDFALIIFFRRCACWQFPVLAVLIICLVAGWWLGASINFFRWHSNRFLLTQLSVWFRMGPRPAVRLTGIINRRVSLVLGPGWLSVLIVGANLRRSALAKLVGDGNDPGGWKCVGRGLPESAKPLCIGRFPLDYDLVCGLDCAAVLSAAPPCRLWLFLLSGFGQIFPAWLRIKT